MAALPYMQFYVADYLADTMHLSTEEHGAYMLLIMNYWRRGKALDGTNGRLASVVRMSNERWQSVEPTLRDFFTVDEDGQWIHPRIEEELQKAQGRIDAAVRAGKASAKSRGNKRSTPVQRPSNARSTPVANPLQPEANHPDPYPYSEVNTQERARTRKAPDDWTPNPIMQRQARVDPGVEIERELIRFRAHTFDKPKDDWDGEWVKWLCNATPRRAAPGTQPNVRVSAEESKHPALVTERLAHEAKRRNGTVKIGDM